jgi:hypothetical protein
MLIGRLDVWMDEGTDVVIQTFSRSTASRCVTYHIEIILFPFHVSFCA